MSFFNYFLIGNVEIVKLAMNIIFQILRAKIFFENGKLANFIKMLLFDVINIFFNTVMLILCT